jgi:hypothetical protein
VLDRITADVPECRKLTVNFGQGLEHAYNNHNAIRSANESVQPTRTPRLYILKVALRRASCLSLRLQSYAS